MHSTRGPDTDDTMRTLAEDFSDDDDDDGKALSLNLVLDFALDEDDESDASTDRFPFYTETAAYTLHVDNSE